MESNVIKCTSCNIVISEVLAYVISQLNTVDEETVCRVCVSSFTPEEIIGAKKLLFDSVPTSKRKKLRKGDKRTLRDIDDIIGLIKETDPNCIPIFVARDLHKLPPITFDHVDVSRLLKDILLLKEAQKVAEERYVTMDIFQKLKNEVDDLKNSSIVNFDDHYNVNNRRGNYLRKECNYESGPQGLHHISGYSPKNSDTSLNSPDQPFELFANSYRSLTIPNVGENGQSGVNKPSATSRQQIAPMGSEGLTHTKKVDVAVSSKAQSETPMSHGTTARVKTPIEHSDGAAAPVEPRMCPRSKSQSAVATIADKLKEPGQWKHESPSEEWKVVQRKRLRNKIVGKKRNRKYGPKW